MIDARVPATLRQQLNALSVDWRNAWFGPAGGAPGFCAFPASAAAAAGVPSLPESKDAVALVHSPCEPLRAQPTHTAELLSELRMGERVTRWQEEDGWWLVAGEDGYVGWARAWTLQSLSAHDYAELLTRYAGRFGEPLGILHGADGETVAPLAMGTPLLRCAEAGAASGSIELADGSRGQLAPGSIDADPPRGTAAEAIPRARALLGAAYRWGGRTASGLDCSGLVQLAYGLSGFALPRDAAQQRGSGAALPSQPHHWQPGDLLFFGEPPEHVGIWVGDGRLLHARARVRCDPYERLVELHPRLSGVRRLGPGDWIREPTLWLRPPRSS